MTGLYVHVPFCIQKCKYCDFISFSNRDEFKSRYIHELQKEMEEYQDIKVDTVFVGGGTPASLSEELLESLLKGIKDTFHLENQCEFTVEANPETVTDEKLMIMKDYGVNRISMGVQSFCDDELVKIGRVHNAKTVFEAVRLIKKHGFLNFNIDLMSALPGQSMESFQNTLQTAVEQQPAHISCYSLIIEENTPLWEEYGKGLLSLPDEDTERDMYAFACSYLREHGYNRYEISNFAKAGFESRHNIKYWRCEEYVGIGLAAHSYYQGVRYANISEMDAYLSGQYRTGNAEKLSLTDQMEEFMIMGLRMDEGISKAEFIRRFECPIEAIFSKPLERFIKDALLVAHGDRISLSEEAVSVSNSILCEFLLPKIN